jgi:hypothetical protein
VQRRPESKHQRIDRNQRQENDGADKKLEGDDITRVMHAPSPLLARFDQADRAVRCDPGAQHHT